MLMVTVKLPYVVADVDRHGNVRYYFRRRPAKKIRLPGKPSSLEFKEAYEAAKVAKLEVAPVKAHLLKGSFAYACHHYFQDAASFKRLDASTQGWQRRALDEIAVTRAASMLKNMRPIHVRRLRDAKIETPAAANTMLKALSALFEWAKERDLVETNPVKEVRRVRYKVKGHHSWTLEEVEAYEARWPVGTRQRLAMAILLYTAGRREDAVALGPQHIVRGRLKFVQGKNKDRSPVEIDIPIHSDLARIIAETPGANQGETFLLNGYDRPYTPAGFGIRFREWCDAAGLPHCAAHGLRKATAARLAERGATPHEIMSITGHRTLEEVERYTRAARMSGLADAGMKRLEKAPKPPQKGGTRKAKSVTINPDNSGSHNEPKH